MATTLDNGKIPLIILHDANPIRLLDAELTLRSLLKPDTEILTITDPAEVGAMLSETRVRAALLDGEAPQQIYALQSLDTRIVWMRERLDCAPVLSGPVVLKPLRGSELRALSLMAGLFAF